MTTHAPDSPARRRHVSSPLIVVAGLVAVFAAAVVGYAIAGGFASESSPGQDIADGVIDAYANGDEASIAAIYDPAVKVALIYDGVEHVIASNLKEETGVIKDSIAFGATLKQIGPVSTYEAADGDLYVAHLNEVTSPSHPDGVPIIGFYRVHNGKVIQQVGIDATG